MKLLPKAAAQGNGDQGGRKSHYDTPEDRIAKGNLKSKSYKRRPRSWRNKGVRRMPLNLGTLPTAASALDLLQLSLPNLRSRSPSELG